MTKIVRRPGFKPRRNTLLDKRHLHAARRSDIRLNGEPLGEPAFDDLVVQIATTLMVERKLRGDKHSMNGYDVSLDDVRRALTARGVVDYGIEPIYSLRRLRRAKRIIITSPKETVGIPRFTIPIASPFSEQP